MFIKTHLRKPVFNFTGMFQTKEFIDNYIQLINKQV